MSSENSLTNPVAFYHGHLLVPFSTVAKSEVGLSSKMPVSPTVIVKKNHPLGCHNLQIHLNAMQTVNINLHDRENKVLLVHKDRRNYSRGNVKNLSVYQRELASVKRF